MNFFAILGLTLVVTIFLIIIRREKPEMAVVLAIAAAGIILSALLKSIAQIITVFESLALKSQFNLDYLKLIIKILGLAYLAGFGAQICKDAGEGSMAAKIELAGKIIILTLGIPVMVGLLNMILKIL
ncbi:MAG TPA: stage III sporulation protein AD [Firmicutes bacterium]|jgi:stage III sporulation protein AD|nr:stage III sporulation protein AD [Bacillota bacterium]